MHKTYVKKESQVIFLQFLSMVERAEQVGGRLEVQTARGEGALITCQLPLGGNHVERREHERGENHPGR